MRQTIRLEVGVSWQFIVREVGGIEKPQVTYEYPDGLDKKIPHSSFFPYAWSNSNQTKITMAVADLKRLMEESNLSLKETAKFLLEPVARDKAPSITLWKNIIEAFFESRNEGIK